MKPRLALARNILSTSRVFSRAGILCLAFASQPFASAATFYWDSTSPFNVAGFGDARGTWAQNSTSNGGRWTTSATGSVAGNGSQPHGVNDIYNFGTATNGLGTGSITVNGTVNMGNTNFGAASGTITLNGGTLNFGADRTITVNNTSNTINSDVAGASTNLTKAGAGRLVFGGNNTYQGTTTISNGILQLDGTHTGGGEYTVGAAGTLQGTGSTTSTVNVTGVLSAGASVGVFTTGTLGLNDGSTFLAELDSSVGLGVAADLLVVNGDLNLGGIALLSMADLADTPVAFALGTAFSLINYSGDWNNSLFTVDGEEVANGGVFTAGLNTWQLDYDASAGGVNFDSSHLADGSFVNVTIIPEPSAALLGALGALALLRRRRA